MSDFNTLKPFELSLWKDELTLKSPEQSGAYLNIYKGLDTDYEDLSFWYFSRHWKETIMTTEVVDNKKVTTLTLGKSDEGASQDISSKLVTTTMNFKPNTEYTLFVEMEFEKEVLNNFWNKYLLTNPNSMNLKIVDLVKKIGENKDTLRTIFNSDVSISYNYDETTQKYSFNLNDSNFSDDDIGIIFQYNEIDELIKIYCVCTLKTNDFLKEQNTVGMWTTFHCFKTGYWTGTLDIKMVEGTQLYNDIKSTYADGSTLAERILNKNNKGLLGTESILYIFQEKVREEVGQYVVGNGQQSQYYNMPPYIFDNVYEELYAVYERYKNIENFSTSTNFYYDIYNVLNKYFPFIPLYSKNTNDAFTQIIRLSNNFEKYLSPTVSINDYENFIKIVRNFQDSSQSREDSIDYLKDVVSLYIQEIITGPYSSNTIPTDDLRWNHLLLELVAFYINNNNTIEYIYNLIYKEIDSNVKEYSLDTYTMNKINVAAYIIALFLITTNSSINDIVLQPEPNQKYKVRTNVFGVLSSTTSITLPSLGIENNVLKVTSGFNKRRGTVYFLSMIAFMGWARFGYYSNTQDASVNSLIGFLPWLNDENVSNTITFEDLIKLLEQNIPLSIDINNINIDDYTETKYYLKDNKLFIFGSDKFNNKSMAQDIQLKRSIKDVNTLTFSLYDNYFDYAEQNFVKNPFVPFLKNESKIRLLYEDNWYDFTIVNIQEDLVEANKIDYTAKDSNVLELSKIGFNKTFNTELDNNIGNINDLTKKTLEGLEWSLDEEKTELIKQWTEQPIFACKVQSEGIIIKEISDTIPQFGNKYIFLFYNEILNEKKDLTILVPKDNNYSTIEETIEHNSTNYILNNIYYYTLNNNFEYIDLDNVHYKRPSFIQYGTLNENNNRDKFVLLLTSRAKQLIHKPKMHYSKPLNRYVYEYKDSSNNNKIYYGFEKNEYSTDSLITNLLPHGQDFINLDDWYVCNTINTLTKTIKSNLDLCITNEDIIIQEQEGDTAQEVELVDGNYSFLKFETDNNPINSDASADYNKPHGFFFNTDLTYNFDKLKSLKVNDEFALRLQIERGIDKSITSSGTGYEDDQIVLLESIVPCIYSYSSVNNIQSYGLSAATEQDQIMYFWYPKQHRPGESIVRYSNKEICNLITRASSGSLVPIYWKYGSELPIFYAYEETISSWLTDYSSSGGSHPLVECYPTNSSNLKSRKYYLSADGKLQLYYFITKEVITGNSQESSFNYHDFPIISSIFKTNNLKLTQESSTETGLLIQLNNINFFTLSNGGYIWNPELWNSSNPNRDITMSQSEDIAYYITFDLTSLNEYKDYLNTNPTKMNTLERYIYNKNTNCFEPINITIEGINSGTSTISGLPLESNQYYNDFDIIMRCRPIWKPVKYSPNNTCIFETIGQYKGKPYINTVTGYSFGEVNYNYEDLLSLNMALFFLIKPTIYDGNPGNSQLALSKVEFFRKYEDENGLVISPSDIIKANVKTIYNLYDPEIIENQTALKENDIVFTYQKYYLEDKYTKVIDENGEKINSITLTESNVYNILQKLAEIFDAWLHIEVKHDPLTGETVGITGEPGQLNIKPIRTIYFTNADYDKNMNYAGIKYGINLKNIQRQIDSDDIINKLIVKNNNNEYGELGFCSIMNSYLNISGSNSIFNFDYYVNNKILNKADVYHLLYNIIYPRTYIIGKKMVDITKNKNEQKIKANQVKAEVDFYKVGCDNIKAELNKRLDEFYKITGFDYSIYMADPNINNSTHPLYIYRNNNQTLTNIRQIEYYTKLLTTYKNHYTSSSKTLKQLEEQIILSEQQIIGLTYQRDFLLNKFYEVYAPYIREGSWISEDYIDDDLYYMDAEKKINESSKPKVTYNINTIDVSNLPEFSHYKFNLYDKTYIEDPEIFGYNENGTPYQEDITVSELTNYLQSPDKNTITVQNYKTQFEDLFQRISSTIQAVEFGTGNYTNTNNDLLKNRILNNDI